MAILYNANDGTFRQVAVSDLGGGNFTTTNAVLLSESGGAFGYAPVQAAGTILTSNGLGVDPTFQAAAGVTFTTTHAVLLSETTTTFGYVGSNTSGFVLTAQGSGADPIFNQGIAGITGGGTPTAGNIGELIDSGAVNGTSLGTGTLANLTSIAVSAGSWDTFGYIVFHFATSAGSAIAGGQSTSSGAFAGFIQFSMAATLGTGTPVRVPAFNQPWSIAGTTNLFLNVQATFGGTCTADGRLWARRVG